MRIRISLAVLLILELGCSSAVRLQEEVQISPEELLTGAYSLPTDEPPAIIDRTNVLSLSSEMRHFLGENVDIKAGSSLKLHQLVYAIINKETFGLEYDDRTRTASETFSRRRGNCLSFSNMFFTMAREVGLDVHFQEVDIPPDWTFKQDAYLLNRHVNIYVNLGRDAQQVVDFNIEDFKSSYDMRIIRVNRALAHFYNNKAVENLQKGDLPAAFINLRMAIVECDSKFSPAWTSLGTVYIRKKLPNHAEAAYLQALKVDRLDLVAMSNLVALYAGRGDLEKADIYRNKVISHRKQNPYYRFHLGREAFFSHDFDTAIRHLRYAVRKRPNEDQFAFLLGLVYLQKGEEAAARRWMARAEEVAASDVLKRNYSTKMDILLSASDSLHH
jgi:Flp pilus assembly protein TadD